MPPQREEKKTEQMISKAHLLRQKKQSTRKRLAYVYLCVFVFLLLLAIGFFWLPFLRIKKIIVPELLTIDKNDAELFIRDHISGRVWGVLPHNNVFLVNKDKLITLLKEQYSTLDTVTLQKDFTALNFTMTERSPKTIWCQDQIGSSPCYFIHEDGTIFDIAGDFSNPLFFVFYTTLDTPEDPIGSLVLPVQEFKRVIETQKMFATYQIKLYGYKKDTDGAEIFFLTPIIFGGESSAYLKSLEVQSAETVVSKTITALKNSTLRDSQRKKFNGLDYIDIRFNDQVSFKLK